MKIAILGAGQLGRMLGLAAIPLGLKVEFLDRDVTMPASAVGPVRAGSLDDPEAIVALARSADVLTTEIENVNTEALEACQAYCPVYPAPAAIAASQDRLAEKSLFSRLDIPATPTHAVTTASDLEGLADTVGYPALLKSRRLGYDGRGQQQIRTPEEAPTAFAAIGQVPAVAEAWVNYERELSLIGVRAPTGETAFYPLCENVHRDGILATTVVPSAHAQWQAQAEDWLRKIMLEFDYVGVLTVEFFLTAEGLLANEMAPRVHNSGHWSIEGAQTSQFENHLRAISGLPLGSTRARGHSAMLNLVGTMPRPERLLGIAGAHLHDYGKAARPGRKLGHCTFTADTREAAMAALDNAQNPGFFTKS